LSDPTQEELEIFSKLHKYILCTTLYSSDKQSGTQVVEYRPYAMHSQSIYAQRHSGKCLHGIKYTGEKDTYVAYQFVDPKKGLSDPKYLQESLVKDLEEREVKNIEIIEQKVWPYFYHFNQEEILQGYPWKILEMQAKNRTLYAGASTCFESVNDVLNYNLMLLNRFAVPK